ncbi:MAG: adenylyl-sulfate reductase, partial [Gammaproteobacteria bacterium]
DVLPPLFMQVYVILMVIAVIAGTLVDMFHKQSARFFFEDWKRKRASAPKHLGPGQMIWLALKTLFYEVAIAGELEECSRQRQISHILMFYGFILYVVATVVLVFAYPTGPAPALWPWLWNLGILMLLVGGYWFFFWLRVNVAFEGDRPYRLIRADLFIVSLLASATLALVWEIIQGAGFRAAAWIAFGLYLLATTVLFVGVPWSKFAHMFYKPAAAFQRRVEEAEGSTDLPRPSDISHIRR